MGSERQSSAWQFVSHLVFATVLASAGCLAVGGQEIKLDTGSAESGARRQHVGLQSEHAEVQAGHPDWIEVRFRVDPGFHINSHTPKDELLIPTTLTLSGGEALKVTGQEYSAGLPLRLDIGSGEVLSTYQGDFRVRLQVVAPRGESVLTGALKYQACDSRSCFPPRSLPVRMTLTAR